MLLGIFELLNFSIMDIVDIVVIAALIYAVYRWIKGSTAMYIFIAVMLLIACRAIANLAGLKMVSAVMGALLDVGVIALIVIFQPEIRRFLNKLGRSANTTIKKRSFFFKVFVPPAEENISTEDIAEICEACEEMSDTKTGALIVLPKHNPLDEIISTGDRIDAKIARRLIMNIFFKNSPLHDGAMIIAHGRIVAARCTLPITDRSDIPARFGMRHKAAVGLSEQSDADVIVVSEQTGKISFVREGKVTDISNINALKLLLGAKNTEE